MTDPANGMRARMDELDLERGMKILNGVGERVNEVLGFQYQGLKILKP